MWCVVIQLCHWCVAIHYGILTATPLKAVSRGGPMAVHVVLDFAWTFQHGWWLWVVCLELAWGTRVWWVHLGCIYSTGF